MQLEDVKVGKGIELQVNRDGYRYRLLSTVEGIGKNKIYITLIASGARVFRFLSSDHVELIYRDENRMYKWSDVKPALELWDGDHVHSFYSEQPGEHFNRRSAFRLSFAEDMIFHHFVMVEKEEQDETSNSIIRDIDEYGNDRERVKDIACSGILKDMSESGAGFLVDDKLDIGAIVGFEIPGLTGQPMYLKGTVVRHETSQHGRFFEFYGMRFTRVDKNLRKYLFEQQRLILKKQREKGLK